MFVPPPVFKGRRVPRRRKRYTKNAVPPSPPPPPPPPPPPTLAHVVSVNADGTTVAVWAFDRPVVAVTAGGATGLACPASGAVVGATVSGPSSVSVEYETEVYGGGGDVWECTAASVSITFGAGGATLQDGSGFISGS